MGLKNIAWELLGISLIITIHELGHWTFCKLFNVGTLRFSIGLTPSLVEKKSALPIGGYVEIEGIRTVQPGHKKYHS